jgi:hypothetical protein
LEFTYIKGMLAWEELPPKGRIYCNVACTDMEVKYNKSCFGLDRRLNNTGRWTRWGKNQPFLHRHS